MIAILLVLWLPSILGDPLQIPKNRMITELSSSSMSSYLIEAMPIGIWMNALDSETFARQCAGRKVCLCYETKNIVLLPGNPCRTDAYVCFSTSVADTVGDHKIHMFSSSESGKAVDFGYPWPTLHFNTEYEFEPFYIDDIAGWAIDGRRYSYDPRIYLRQTIIAQPLKIYEKYRSGAQKPERAFKARFFSECPRVASFRVKNIIGGPIYDGPNDHPPYDFDSTNHTH